MSVGKLLAWLTAATLGLGPGFALEDARALARLAALAAIPGVLHLVAQGHRPLAGLALLTVMPCAVLFGRELGRWRGNRHWRRRWRLR